MALRRSITAFGFALTFSWASLSLAAPAPPQFPLATSGRPSSSNLISEADVLAAGGDFTTLSHPNLPGYSLRVKTTTQLCDQGVKQHVGYLDVADDRHFFFWFFESRSNPAVDPVTIWLNGGPGCSSMTGLLMELGPCRPTPGGDATVNNPWSWTNVSSVLFLDQPVNVGFSYSDDGQDKELDTESAAKDVYAFLLIFFSTFKTYQPLDFHVTGESYAGHYIPAIGAVIVEGNKNAEAEGFPVINLKSLAIGNGMTDPLVQYEYYPEMACSPPDYDPVIKDPEVCQSMKSKVKTCTGLINSCYKWKSTFSCIPASYYCNSGLLSPYQQSGQNMYDVRSKCSSSNSLCYDILTDIEKYLNRGEVKSVLGVGDRKFVSCNTQVNMDFQLRGDWMRPFVRLIPSLLDKAGVRVLIYAGAADFICNWLGNKAWTLRMDWSGKTSFNAAADQEWVTDSGKSAGEFRTFGKLSFVKVMDAGHMVPYDQSESAFDMFKNWIHGQKFVEA